MSILTAIFQAIGQVIVWVFPISESGHSAIFHNFSGRFTNACSQLTGVIHIGIAIGIFIACFKLFKVLFKSFFTDINDICHKRFSPKSLNPIRKFVYMTALSFAPLIFYVIPVGKSRNLFQLLHMTTYDKSLLIEGIFFALTGALLIFADTRMNIRINEPPAIAQSLVIGVAALIAIPTGGCSLVAAVFALCIIMGMSRALAFKYSMVMSVVVLLVGGIVELCIAVTKVSIVQAIIALVLSAVVAFLCARIFNNITKKGFLKYIAYYDVAIGLICAVIGIFQIIMK